ncbi:hypothetical protein AVEN_128479-1 [Araneus ventricosus]|uniref:Reverse transcriptase domain-containing protein n=1 Tax=Araneus ventricosus TaxID=182803 RepID=A0A4Y2VI01_ARAVE|nr:hypothetical protein AVEN_128479-1 [Araneus ventricosus]
MKNFCTQTKDPYGIPYKAILKHNLPHQTFSRLWTSRKKATPSPSQTEFFKSSTHKSLSPSNASQRQPQKLTVREEAFTKNEIARIMQKVPIKKALGYDGIDFIEKQIGQSSLPPSKFGQNTGEIAFGTTQPPPHLQHPNQYGFRTNRSTEEAILDLLDKMNSAKNSNQHALMISLDIKGAFDHLQYISIKNSLDNLKYHSNTLETLIYILSNRKVAINTSQGPATWNQQQGCPQGS